MELKAPRNLSTWVRLAFALAAMVLVSACVGSSSPAWLQDDHAIRTPESLALDA